MNSNGIFVDSFRLSMGNHVRFYSEKLEKDESMKSKTNKEEANSNSKSRH